MNFKVEDKKTRKAIKVHYDLKKYRSREKLFTPEPQAKRKTTIKEQKNSDLNSPDDGDIIEIESSTDCESNLNTENLNTLNVANETSENEAKESEQETSKRQEQAQNLPEGGGATSSKATEYTEKKPAKTKIPKSEKKQQESSSKRKSSKKD